MALITTQVPSAPTGVFDPNAEMELKRRRALAERLMKAGEQPQGTEMVSGIAVRQSPLAALARAMTQGVAGYESNKADTAEVSMNKDRQGRLAEAINSGKLDSLANGSPEEQMMALKQKLAQQDDARKYAQAMELAKFKAEQDPTTGGGAVGSLVKQYMQSTGLPFDQALYAVQTGMRQGQQMTPEGTVIPMTGVPEAKGAIKAGEVMGQKGVELQMNPQIAGAEKTAQLNAERTGGVADKALGASKSNEMLQMAKDILPKATGSLLGAGYAAGKGALGISDESTQANADLETLAGWLTSNVPRMQGPQSDKDTLMYAQMAAKVGDKTKPVGDRLSAIKVLEDLNNKYTQPQQLPNQTPTGATHKWNAQTGQLEPR